MAAQGAASVPRAHGPVLCMALALSLTLLFYGAALGFDLVWDDLTWVNDFHRHSLASLLEDNFTSNTLVSYYRPLVAASFSLQLAASSNAAFLHGFNLALHAVNLCLVVLLAGAAAHSARWRVPLAVTVLAIHPVLVEPVVWVSGRFDLFYTTFLLLCLRAALRVTSPLPRFVACAVLFFAALCCKESALAWLAVGPLLVACITRPISGDGQSQALRAATRHGAALLVGAAAYCALRLGVLDLPLVRDTAFQVNAPLDLADHALMVLRTFGTYGQMTLAPLWNLAPLHAVAEDARALDGYAVTGALLLALAVAGLRWTACLPVTVWTLALLPAANLLPFRLDLVQCRYLYFPLFAALLCALHVPWPAPRVPRTRVLLWLIVGLWLGALAVTNLSIARLWRDGVSLFSWTVSIRPSSRFALENLALAHHSAGQYRQALEVERRIPEAARSFQGWLLMARASRDSGDVKSAIKHYQRALATPAYDDAMQVSALYELALAWRSQGDQEQSARVAAEAEALAARQAVSQRLCDYYRRALRE